MKKKKSFKAFKRKCCKTSHIMEYFATEDFKRGRKKPQLSKRNKQKPTTTKAPTIRNGTLTPCFTAQGV